MAIIISEGGKNAKRVDKSSFEREDYLQGYIYENPDSIPLYEIKENIRLLILAREFPTDSGPIDAIGVDRDGEIYLIETKLYKNADKRLVVAQVLDYGASLWRSGLDFNEFVRVLEINVNGKFGVGLHQKLRDFFGIEDPEIVALLDGVRRNLNEGNFRFVVLMDKLHNQLRDLIVFLNANSRFDVFAVELEYYKHKDFEIMIPKLFGAEVKKDIAITSSGPRKKWDEAALLDDARQRLGQDFDYFEKIYNFSKAKADQINFGTGSYATFSPIFLKLSSKSLFTVGADKRLSFNFEWIGRDNEETRDKFKTAMENIGFRFGDDYREARPSVSVEGWGPKSEEFILAVQKLAEA